MLRLLVIIITRHAWHQEFPLVRWWNFSLVVQEVTILGMGAQFLYELNSRNEVLKHLGNILL